MRILHGPVNVGNQAWVLSRAERALGADSTLAVNYSTWLNYPADRVVGSLKDCGPGAQWKRAAHALGAPFRHDVMHYYFGRSFACWDDCGGPNRLWFADLRLARLLGRKVFMTLQGCDVRMAGASAETCRWTPCAEGRCQSYRGCRNVLDRRKERLVRDILPLCDRVFVLNPELCRDAPEAQFLPYCSVDLNAMPVAPPRTDGPVRILHAPSDPGVKGSRLVIEAVNNLKKRHDIEFILVQGMSYDEAMALYPSADLVVDQLLCGWYGGFAVELMAMGKPVACYLRDEDLHVLPQGMRGELPLVRLTPETVEADLERAIGQRSQWPEWGMTARKFAYRWHNPERTARAMLRAYADPRSRFNLEDA